MVWALHLAPYSLTRLNVSIRLSYPFIALWTALGGPPNVVCALEGFHGNLTALRELRGVPPLLRKDAPYQLP